MWSLVEVDACRGFRNDLILAAAFGYDAPPSVVLACGRHSVRGTGVPRTIKLSERFYQKFGHDLVDEMVNWFNQTDETYRVELRELNDLNFARFDAKLEQRLAAVKAEWRQEIAHLRTEVLSAIASQRSDLVKWMFAFWIGQAGLTIGLVLLVTRNR